MPDDGSDEPKRVVRYRTAYLLCTRISTLRITDEFQVANEVLEKQNTNSERNVSFFFPLWIRQPVRQPPPIKICSLCTCDCSQMSSCKTSVCIPNFTELWSRFRVLYKTQRKLHILILWSLCEKNSNHTLHKTGCLQYKKKRLML